MGVVHYLERTTASQLHLDHSGPGQMPLPV
jgi:hypothetical protein